MSKTKRRMTEQQEFEVMKLVLDKFLWLGFIVMGWGMFTVIKDAAAQPGIWYVLAGAALLFVFVWVIVKEYEVLRYK